MSTGMPLHQVLCSQIPLGCVFMLQPDKLVRQHLAICHVFGIITGKEW